MYAKMRIFVMVFGLYLLPMVMTEVIPTCTRVFSRFITYSAGKLFKNESIELKEEIKITHLLKMKHVRLVKAPQVTLTGRRFFYTIDHRGFFNTSIRLSELEIGFKLKLGILPASKFQLYFEPIYVNVVLEFLPVSLFEHTADQRLSLFRLQFFDIVDRVKYNSKKSKGFTGLLKLINAKKLNQILVQMIERNAKATIKSRLESLRLPDMSRYISQ
ncbi:hypothetical protein Ciccas_001336 [Cichlidogyrus casuarinus]|uniref:Uncharacterized protein n=1 Tax=Cichlidogyrus casuarinus TaxID=1844966 RepID=A0ABD2QKL5_9PLAT